MIAVVLIGVLGGIIAGMLGVGGGVAFVPALVLIVGLSQQQAEATSLLAIAPVALVGAVIQDRHGAVHRRDAAWIGVLAIPGTAAGVALANAVSGSTLRIAFSAFLIFVAARLVVQTARKSRSGDDPTGEAQP